MTGMGSLVIAGSAMAGAGALVVWVRWRARWRAAHTVVARAPLLARLPVLDETTEFAPVAGFPPWEPARPWEPPPPRETAGGLMFSTAGVMGCDSGAMAAVHDPGDQWWPGPDSEPPEPDDGPLEELPEWTDEELARLHDAPTVFDVDWVESWLSDGWADRMAAEIRSWKVGL